MDVDIQKRRIRIQHQAAERILMLHKPRRIAVFYAFPDDVIFDIASVDIVVFKVSVSA